MKHLLILILLANGSVFGQDMNDYLWKNRVVLIFGDNNDHRVKKQLKAFTTFAEELKDRDMLILVPKKGEKPRLLERLSLDDSFSGLLLIGKDGGIKLNQSLVVHPKTLFDLIDAMPMRQSEMRKKQKGLH